MQSMRPHPTVAHPGHPRRRGAFKVAGAAAAIAASGWMVASCSLVYDLSTEQCNTDLDCTSKGGVFADMVCVQNLCEPPTQSGCNSNVECIEREGNFGQPSACIDRECVDLITPECPLMLPFDDLGMANLRTDDPLILAAYANVEELKNGAQLLNYNLVLSEFQLQTDGLLAAGGGRRSVVMLACDGNTGGDRESLDESLAHMIKLKVPGIVAGMLSDDLQYVFESGGLAAEMFFISPYADDEALRALGDAGLIWYLLPSTSVLARAYAPLLQRTLTYLEIDPAQPVKVASLVATDLRLMVEALGTVESADFGIRFNGLTLGENATAGNYRSYAITSVYTDPEATFDVEIADILELKPQVIIAAAADEFLATIVPAIERDWPVGSPRPFYLLSPYHYGNEALLPLLASNPDVRARLVGIGAPANEDTRLYDEYTMLWDREYPEHRDIRGTENFYDAAYYLLYAAMGAGDILTSGIDLRRGMIKLLSGTRYDMNDQLATVQSILGGAGSIELHGTMGAPNFDQNTGTRQAVGSAWCVDTFDTTRADVLRYRAANGETEAFMEGTMDSCIPNF